MSTSPRPADAARTVSPSFASRAQVRANRRNAKRSTGPRTAEGKRRSSLNAATHGMFAKDLVLPGERDSQYIAFRNLLLNARGLNPQDWLELSLADQYVAARWRLRRLPGVEAHVHEIIASELAEIAEAPVEALAEVLHLNDRLVAMRGKEEDENENDEDDDDKPSEATRRRAAALSASMAALRAMAAQRRVPPEATMASAFVVGRPTSVEGGRRHNPYEHLARHQQRLELSASRALRDLRQLRKDLGIDVATLPPCPFIEPVPEDEEDALSSSLDGSENVVAEATTPPDRGVVTSVTTGSRDADGDGDEKDDDVAQANKRNEPNSASRDAGVVASEPCEQRSCNIEPIAPTKLARRGAEKPAPDGKEAQDRA